MRSARNFIIHPMQRPNNNISSNRAKPHVIPSSHPGVTRESPKNDEAFLAWAFDKHRMILKKEGKRWRGEG